MKQFLKATVLATAVAATTLTAIPTANANPAAAWAIAGIAGGALLLGGLAYHNNWGWGVTPAYAGVAPLYAPNYVGTSPLYGPDYAAAAPLYGPNYVGTAPLYGPGYVTTALVAWSPAWFQYCQNRYRTFNARTGTFIGIDGRPHFCGR